MALVPGFRTTMCPSSTQHLGWWCLSSYPDSHEEPERCAEMYNSVEYSQFSKTSKIVLFKEKGEVSRFAISAQSLTTGTIMST